MNVVFPVEPYPQQLEYVDHLLNAIKNCQNALLEYPRGGGRTLALLAGCFSWLMQKLEGETSTILPKIIFVCRNNSRIPDVRQLNSRSLPKLKKMYILPLSLFWVLEISFALIRVCQAAVARRKLDGVKL